MESSGCGGLLRWVCLHFRTASTTMEINIDDDVATRERGLLRHQPKQCSRALGAVAFPPLGSPSSPLQLTVWCKSLLFHGKGYTVYDGSSGAVVFRVDYAHDRKEGTVLMDCVGGVVLTIRRRRAKLGILESWWAYKGDREAVGFAKQRPLFKAKKALGISCCKVSMVPSHGGTEPPVGYTYRMSWSRQEHWFKIYHYQATASTALPVAEARRKCCARPEILLGEDVLTLEVQPEMDPAVAMALMIITHTMK